MERRNKVRSGELHKNRVEKWKTVRALAMRREFVNKLISDNNVAAKLEETETWGEALEVLVEEILKQVGKSTKFFRA